MNSDGPLPLDEHNDAHILKTLNTYRLRKDAAAALRRSTRTLSRWIQRRNVQRDAKTGHYYLPTVAPFAPKPSSKPPSPAEAPSNTSQPGATFHFPTFDNTVSTQPRPKRPPPPPENP